MNDEYPYILKIVKQKLQIMKTFKRRLLSEIQFRNFAGEEHPQRRGLHVTPTLSKHFVVGWAVSPVNI
jgi:hypothetical protein